MENFNRFIAIDWSGAEKPVVQKGIAVASCHAGLLAPILEDKKWSRASIADWIESLSTNNIRTLIGIDCNFSYGQETGRLQFGENYMAFDLWDAVEAACEGQKNYFAGRYWAHDDHGRHFWTKGKRPDGFLSSPRMTEVVCRDLGLGHPESPFKLIGPKQVGKGGLSGMRFLRDLKNRLGNKIAIWPFDENTDKATLVIAEIYPRLFLTRAGYGNKKVKTKGDLDLVLKAFKSAAYGSNAAFTDHQSDAVVSAAGLRMLCGTGKTVPDLYSVPSAGRDVLMQEGWIFGVAGKD